MIGPLIALVLNQILTVTEKVAPLSQVSETGNQISFQIK